MIILCLKLLQLADLIALQAPLLLPPPVIGDLVRPDGSNSICNASALRRQHIHLAQLADVFLRVGLFPGILSSCLIAKDTLSRGPAQGGEIKVVAPWKSDLGIWDELATKVGMTLQ